MNVCLLIHNHQPPGVTDERLRACCADAWLPALNAVRERTRLHLLLYHSAPAWEWLARNGLDYVTAVRQLVVDGRADVLGGGAYEPLLPLISDEDALGHLSAMARRIEGQLDHTPRGIWLDAVLWEPWLPSLLVRTDTQWLVASEELAGGSPVGPVVVEDRGHSLRLFPIRSGLVDPGAPVSATVDAIKAVARTATEGLVVVPFDADLLAPLPGGGAPALPVEKFARLLDGLAALEREGAVRSALPQTLVDAGVVVGRSFPSAGIGREGLPLRESVATRGAVEGLYRKMLHVSRKIQSSGRATGEIKEALLRGQSATAVMRGTAGQRPLRRALWRELIRAEDLIDGKLHGKGSWVDVEEVDYDGDGHAELLVGCRPLHAYFAPARGGVLFELDYKPRLVNVLDAAGAPDALFRGAFVDLFPASLASPEEAAELRPAACGWDPFGRVKTEVASDRDTRLVFSREGRVRQPGGGECRVSLEKTFRFVAEQAEFKVRYRLVNRGPGDLAAPFAVALGVRAPSAGIEPDTLLVDGREVEGCLDRPVAAARGQEVVLEDRQVGYRMRFQFTQTSRLFVVPVRWPAEPCGTVGLLPVWDGPLPEGEVFELDLAADFEPLELPRG